MDPEKVATTSTSKQITQSKKSSNEGSISSEKSMNKSKSHKQGKPAKLKKTENQKIKEKRENVVPKITISKDPNLTTSVNKLRERAKRVKAKLSAMQRTSTELRIHNIPSNNVNNEQLDKEGILREIEVLQGLMEQLKLKATSMTENKSGESNKSSNEDENDREVVNSVSKKSRKRHRYKKSKSKTSEEVMQEIYVKHINQIIQKDAKVKDPNLPKFKMGDDLEEFATKCVAAGLGQIVEADIRVNAKNNHQAFITMEGGSDASISSPATRRFAMDGDLVRVFVRNKGEDTRESVADLDDTIPLLEDLNDTINDPETVIVADVDIQKRDRAFVIRILKETGNRTFVGSIAFKNPSKHDDGEYLKFKSRDTKAPIMCIPVESCKEYMKQDQDDDIVGYLFVAQILKIEENGRCLGKLVAPIGKCDNLETEIKAILMNNHLSHIQPFEKRFDDMWVESVNVEPSDLKNREDLRKECIFTIDPLTARDLDDAVSCKKLNNDRYEIGVHISDVAHFLEESSELDELVKLRATSIYLVNEVIHMLPRTLCMKCSLLPNEDKFAFSVFWVIDKDANVISTRFTRTVIRSCTQLAYEHVQKIIDNPSEIFTDNDFPTICNGFSSADIIERVKILNSLAVNMRTRRFANGSLAIDKPQYYFLFDPDTGEPTSYEIATRLSANFLIEEFMLLANQAVAKMIYQNFPEIAFLRSHQPPKPSAIKSLKIKLNAVGIELDMSSSNSISNGLKKICGSHGDSKVVSVAMSYLLTKPMMRAKYFCSENIVEESDLRHYALAIPIYTHFTSPIRRYPDILVHRLLSAAMKYTEPPKRSTEELHQLARICNDQKFNAKCAGEESSNLYFKRYINAKKSHRVRAVVVDIYKHCIEVITLDTEHLIPIPFKIQKVNVNSSKAPAVIYISEHKSTKPPLELKLFSDIELDLAIYERRLTGYFVSPDPEQAEKNAMASSETKSRNSDQKIHEKNNRSVSNDTATQKRRQRRRRARASKDKVKEDAKTIDTKV